MINKSATKACEIGWNNGNVTTLWVGVNSNTGETIVWQVTRRDGKPGRSSRITGRNIGKLRSELDQHVNNVEGFYTFTDAAAMAAIH